MINFWYEKFNRTQKKRNTGNQGSSDMTNRTFDLLQMNGENKFREWNVNKNPCIWIS
jgi:hypothetical protein